MTTLTPGRALRALVVAALSALTALAVAVPAEAAPLNKRLLTTSLTVPKAVGRTCFSRPHSGAGLASRAVTAPAFGLVQARLTARSGDWDLAVFDARTGRTVAGSTHFGARELAEGFVNPGQRLTVQACRVRGGASTAQLSVQFEGIESKDAGTVQMVRVITPTRADVARLTELGLDLTEHGGNGFVEVVLYGEADAAKLLRAGFAYSVVVRDLAKRDQADRRAERQFASTVATSGLPSGRTTYRRLMDYSNEMKALAFQHPHLVKPITLSRRTYEGRPMEGIEITTNPNARDGKPVFLQMGAHHAREWPSAEHAMEWAYELIRGYNNGDPRTKALVEKTRTIVIPVVNPDGFNASREAGELLGAGGGRGGNENNNILTSPQEYRRKNCRLPDDSALGNCAPQPGLGLVEGGVDLNRNYGGFWGGPGASSDPANLTYHGPEAFSEPETKNIRELIASRHVTTLITNHTFSNLVLRPPGIASEGLAPDEPIYKALGDAMASKNGYSSQFGWQLYDTTGTTEDWSYYATGGLGFTFEIGRSNFHPPFADVIAEYNGTTQAAGNRGGNREAYFVAQENTANAARHSIISGRAPAGAVLKLSKTFETPTSRRNADRSFITFTDTLSTVMDVPSSGVFEWHVNPSTRPLRVRDRGRIPTGPPSDPITFSGLPNESAIPCADFNTTDETCWNDHPFEIPGAPFDNAYAVIRAEWITAASDWDMKVFRDVNGDGSSVGDPQVGSSGQGPTDFEQSTLGAPAPGKYLVRMINYAAAEPYDVTVTYYGPDRFEAKEAETWTMTCEFGGKLRWAQQVKVDRGKKVSFDLRKSCKQ